MSNPLPSDARFGVLVDAALAGAREVMAVYATDFAVQRKADDSPVSAADKNAEQAILTRLSAAMPELPVIAEEACSEGAAPQVGARFALVDPLDGTKEFVNRNGEFTVNIALVVNGRPVLGVVHVPVQHTTYTGCEGHGADKRIGDGRPEKIHVAAKASLPPRVVGSRSHRGASLDAFLERLGAFDMVPMGSSLKFCVVAEGGADVYPRLGPTSEWDTAAAQAVVEQAGGRVVTVDGTALAYNRKEDILNPWFVVIGARDRDWLALLPDRE
jgi:3'(2'), 5'-bisphosphate nucleotidase